MLRDHSVSRHGVQPSTPGGIAGAIAGFAFYQWWATSRPPYDALNPHGLLWPQLIALALFIGLSFRYNRQGNLTRFIFSAAATVVACVFAVGVVVQQSGLVNRPVPPQEREFLMGCLLGLILVAALFGPIACDFATKHLGQTPRGGVR